MKWIDLKKELPNDFDLVILFCQLNHEDINHSYGYCLGARNGKSWLFQDEHYKNSIPLKWILVPLVDNLGALGICYEKPMKKCNCNDE